MKLTRTKVTELKVSEEEFFEFSGFDYFGSAVKVPGRTKTTFQIIGFKA